VKRIDGANSGSSPTVTDISSGLSAFSYVYSLAVDPTDSDDVIAVFSKYNLQSLWYSTNGRATVWTQGAVSSIGNTATVMLNWRDNDRTLAVATHGKGVYSATAASPLPVELSSFSGILQNPKVNLLWKPETGVDNYGSEILRAVYPTLGGPRPIFTPNPIYRLRILGVDRFF